MHDSETRYIVLEAASCDFDPYYELDDRRYETLDDVRAAIVQAKRYRPNSIFRVYEVVRRVDLKIEHPDVIVRFDGENS